jgi:hypothetical protein
LESLPEESKRLAREPHGETDEDQMPLQAADLLAWHAHRDFVETQNSREHKDSVWSALQDLNTYPLDVITEEQLHDDALG